MGEGAREKWQEREEGREREGERERKRVSEREDKIQFFIYEGNR